MGGAVRAGAVAIGAVGGAPVVAVCFDFFANFVVGGTGGVVVAGSIATGTAVSDGAAVVGAGRAFVVVGFGSVVGGAVGLAVGAGVTGAGTGTGAVVMGEVVFGAAKLVDGAMNTVVVRAWAELGGSTAMGATLPMRSIDSVGTS